MTSSAVRHVTFLTHCAILPANLASSNESNLPQEGQEPTMKRVIAITTAATVIALSGCTITPVSPKKAAPVPDSRVFAYSNPSEQRKAAVQITSDASNALFMASQTYIIRIDGRKVVEMAPSETVRVWVTPGDHVVSTDHIPRYFHADEGITCLRLAAVPYKGVFVTPTALCPYNQTSKK